MTPLMAGATDPVATLITVARQHAIFCRRDIARVAMTLRIEFSGQDHPVGTAVDEAVNRLLGVGTQLVTAGRDNGTIPTGPPADVLAQAVLGAVEGLVIDLAGQAPFDEELAERAVIGLLGLSPQAVPVL